MQLCNSYFPSVCLWVCEWVCEWVSEFVNYAEMSQKTAFCYKNIIRNAKLRKLIYIFLLFFFLKWSPKNFFFLPYEILWSSTRIFFRFCFFNYFFSNVPNEHGRSFVTFHTSLFISNSIFGPMLRFTEKLCSFRRNILYGRVF